MTCSKLSEASNVIWVPQNPESVAGSSIGRLRFLIPANTGVTVKGHRFYQRYGYIPVDDEQQDVTLKFTYEGKYDVIITRTGKTYTKHLEVD